jgi:hypothetical protein
MKRIYTKRRFSVLAITLASALALTSVLFYACKKPTDGINILIASNTLFPSPSIFKVYNADTVSNLRPGGFPANITGLGASFVQLSSGGTNFNVLSSGLLETALTKDANASKTNPIVFALTANIPGFAPVTQNVAITGSGLTIFPVKAVEYAHPPVGTTVLAGVTTPLSAGALSSAYTLTTAKTATMNEQATLSFAAGTQMLDANGVALTGTTLTSNIVQFGTGTDASLQALPGGLYAPVAYKNDNTPISGGVNLVTAGLLQVNLDASGAAVKKFSKPVAVSVELNNNLVNFATGLAVAVGDKIPVWSMSETTGAWTNEIDATVVLDANNRKAAQFNMTHLSCWALDWSWGGFGAYSTCGGQLAVTVNPSDPTYAGGPYEVTLETPSGQYLAAIHGVTISNGSVFTFTSLPNIPQAKVVVSGGIPYTRAQSALFSTCSAGSTSVTVPITSNNPINVTLSIKGICTAKNITILPTATFELYEQTGGSQAQNTAVFADAGTIQLTNGVGAATMQVGQQYYFVTTYNGVEYKTDPFSVAKASIPIPSSTSALTASATYDATTNTLNIVGVIPVNCN